MFYGFRVVPSSPSSVSSVSFDSPWFFCFRFTRLRSLRWERAAAATIAAVAATTAAADAEAIAVSAAAASGDAAALKGSLLLSCALLF